MIPAEMLGGARIIGGDGQPTAEEMRQFQEMQRMAHIEMYRQATAQQCLVALIVKSMASDDPPSTKTLARRAREAADALAVEFFGEDALSG